MIGTVLLYHEHCYCYSVTIPLLEHCFPPSKLTCLELKLKVISLFHPHHVHQSCKLPSYIFTSASQPMKIKVCKALGPLSVRSAHQMQNDVACMWELSPCLPWHPAAVRSSFQPWRIRVASWWAGPESSPGPWDAPLPLPSPGRCLGLPPPCAPSRGWLRTKGARAGPPDLGVPRRPDPPAAVIIKDHTKSRDVCTGCTAGWGAVRWSFLEMRLSWMQL